MLCCKHTAVPLQALRSTQSASQREAESHSEAETLSLAEALWTVGDFCGVREESHHHKGVASGKLTMLPWMAPQLDMGSTN